MEKRHARKTKKLQEISDKIILMETPKKIYNEKRYIAQEPVTFLSIDDKQISS